MTSPILVRDLPVPRDLELATRWAYSFVRCRCCGWRWLAVYPAGSDANRLECSVCRESATAVLFLGEP